MATETRKATTGQAPKAGTAASAQPDGGARPGAERAGKQKSADPAKRTKPAAERTGKSTQKSKRQPYHVEITALADNTAELPSPVRERAVQIVRTIVGLFEWAWQELRRLLTSKDAGEEIAAPDDAGPAARD